MLWVHRMPNLGCETNKALKFETQDDDGDAGKMKKNIIKHKTLEASFLDSSLRPPPTQNAGEEEEDLAPGRWLPGCTAKPPARAPGPLTASLG